MSTKSLYKIMSVESGIAELDVANDDIAIRQLIRAMTWRSFFQDIREMVVRARLELATCGL